MLAFMRVWLRAIELMKNEPEKATRIVRENFAGQGFDVSEQAIKLMLSKLDVTPDFMPEVKDYLTRRPRSSSTTSRSRRCRTGTRGSTFAAERSPQERLSEGSERRTR